MTSPRQREIKNAMNIRTFILVLAFLCFWAPLMYLWAWLLWPLDMALVLALGFGVGGSCIVYTFWEDYGKKLDRLLKYTTLFGPFFEAMITDMEANDAEKGDSWLTMEIEELVALQNKKIHQLQKGRNTLVDLWTRQPKLANYCAMIYLRGIKE